MVLKRTVASTVAYLTQNEVQSAHVESTQHCGISLFVCWGGGLGVGGGISSLYLKHLIKNIWSWQAGRGGGGGGGGEEKISSLFEASHQYLELGLEEYAKYRPG